MGVCHTPLTFLSSGTCRRVCRFDSRISFSITLFYLDIQITRLDCDLAVTVFHDDKVSIFENTCITNFLLGDVNLDGIVNLLDVAPFVHLVSLGCFQTEADINQDGDVNLLDISPFVELLID